MTQHTHKPDGVSSAPKRDWRLVLPSFVLVPATWLLVVPAAFTFPVPYTLQCILAVVVFSLESTKYMLLELFLHVRLPKLYRAAAGLAYLALVCGSVVFAGQHLDNEREQQRLAQDTVVAAARAAVEPYEKLQELVENARLAAAAPYRVLGAAPTKGSPKEAVISWHADKDANAAVAESRARLQILEGRLADMQPPTVEQRQLVLLRARDNSAFSGGFLPVFLSYGMVGIIELGLILSVFFSYWPLRVVLTVEPVIYSTRVVQSSTPASQPPASQPATGQPPASQPPATGQPATGQPASHQPASQPASQPGGVSSVECVCNYLVGEINRGGGSTIGSHRKWGAACGANRETVGKAVAQLVDLGLVRKSRGPRGTTLSI